jgi:hypothetical protein
MENSIFAGGAVIQLVKGVKDVNWHCIFVFLDETMIEMRMCMYTGSRGHQVFVYVFVPGSSEFLIVGMGECELYYMRRMHVLWFDSSAKLKGRGHCEIGESSWMRQ